MTEKEKIRAESKDLEEAAKASGQRHFPDAYNIWARPNYEAKRAELAFKEGANWQKRQMIDKACEWLLNNIRYYSTNALGAEYMCNDFRKAMEDEK